MSFYEEHSEAINGIVVGVVALVGGWFTKDRFEAMRSKTTDAKEVLEMMKDLLKELKEDNHKCEEKLQEMADEIRGLKQEVELYRKRVLELELKFGQA